MSNTTMEETQQFASKKIKLMNQIDYDAADSGVKDKYAEITRRRLQAIYDKGCDGNRYQPMHKLPFKSMHKFYLHLTYNCPLRCPFCSAEGGERRSEELKAEQYYNIIVDAIDAGFAEIVLTGGEPLIYKELDELLLLLKCLDRKASKLTLRSSFAFAITEARMQEIAELFDYVAISIDGDETRHDSIRGKGSFAKTLANIHRLQSYKSCKLDISAVMEMELFEGEQGAFVKAISKELGAARVLISYPKPMGRGKNIEAKPYLWRWPYSDSFFPTMRYRCDIGHRMHVEPNGDAYPCYTICSQGHFLGNLTQIKVADIIHSNKFLGYCDIGVDTNEKCKNCEVRYLCGGMCQIHIQDENNVNSGNFFCDHKQELLDYLVEAGVTLRK